MNITVPQNVQTKTELEELSDVKHLLISAETSSPVMGGKQDCILGAYNMTQESIKIPWKIFMNLITYLELPKNVKIEKGKIYTGRDLFSSIIPERIEKQGNGKDMNIVKGQLVSGCVKKSAVAAGQANNLMQLTMDEYGVDEMRRIFDNIQKLVNQFNLYHGFTISLSDTIITSKLQKQIDEMMNTEILNACIHVTEMENNPNMISEDLFERDIKTPLNNVRDSIGKLIMSNFTTDNGMSIMSVSGTSKKVNNDNTSQIAGILAQQSLEGHRMPKKAMKRTLPYFARDDDTPYSRGFIGHCFQRGLEYAEFVFHNMSSREGLIDTAVKTAETGYIQRKLIKMLEDVMVSYDSTLRTANNTVVQFIYGDTGADTTKQYSYHVDLLEMNDKDILNKYTFTKDEINKLSDYSESDNIKYGEWLLNFRTDIRNAQIKFHMDYKTFNKYINFMLPVNLPRILDIAKNNKHDKTVLTPKYVLDKLDSILEHKLTSLVCVTKSETETMKLKDEATAKISLRLALHNAFAPKRCIMEYKLSKESFDSAMQMIIENYQKNLVEAGEMVGIITSQSICHPLTQLTLNTFHHSGIGAMGTTTLGVPRIRELFSLTRAMKTPRMQIYLNKENQKNKEFANRIASHIKQTTIEDIRNRIDIYYDPEPDMPRNQKELDKVGQPFFSHGAEGCQAKYTDYPWLVRIEFNREKLLLNNVTLLDIQSKFCNMWENRYEDLKKATKEERTIFNKITGCSVMSNSDNDDIPVVHIRFEMVDFTLDTIRDFIDIIIDKFKINGFEDITGDVIANEESHINFDNPEHTMETTKEYAIFTSGINMYDIRNIAGVDLSRTMCNDIMTVYDMFGIEAARSALINEIMTVIANAGSTLNYNHLSVLVDLMARDGFLISVDRHGMGRTENAPLGKVSFEKPVEQLLLAAIFNETDPLKGVSARIMSGNVIKGGTGLCDIIVDTDMIEKSEFVETGVISRETITTEDEVIIDDIMNKPHDDTFIPM